MGSLPPQLYCAGCDLYISAERFSPEQRAKPKWKRCMKCEAKQREAKKANKRRARA